MEMRKFIKSLIRIKRYKYGWKGDYRNWQQAKMNSLGYDANGILAKVKSATLCVKSGKAEYERASVLFDSIEYSWPLLCALMWVAATNES